MKKIRIFYAIWGMFFLLFCNSMVFAEVIFIKPQGEIATISVEKSNNAYLVLRGGKPGDKVKVAAEVDANPGDYHPYALLALGLHYITEKNFEKAAIYLRGAAFRAVVDVKASNDSSLQDVVPTMFESMQIHTRLYLTPSENQKYIDCLVKATENLINWDKMTPRNYDVRWASLHSIKASYGGNLNYASPAQYKKIVEDEYELFRQSAQSDGIIIR